MDWISIEDKLPNVFAGKFRVKRKNSIELDCFFYEDKISWIAYFGQKPTYWWDSQGRHEPIYDVTHWKNCPT